MRKAIKTKDMVVGKVYYDSIGGLGYPYKLVYKDSEEIRFWPNRSRKDYIINEKSGLILFGHSAYPWYEEVEE